MLVIREATAVDAPVFTAMIRELVELEHDDQVDTSEDLLPRGISFRSVFPA
ncbi:MAG TPA: hypothetical protein VMH03_10625 [Terriglobales bacterium]|nr:hypothetical protein [Terriglobales bacterium]